MSHPFMAARRGMCMPNVSRAVLAATPSWLFVVAFMYASANGSSACLVLMYSLLTSAFG